MKLTKKNGWPALLILLAGCIVTVVLVALEEEESFSYVPDPAMLVEAVPVVTTDYRVQITAWGFVKPRETIEVVPQVAGQVAEVSDTLHDGAAVARGQSLFSIDARRYENALAEATGVYEQARQALAIETGRQAIARSEYSLLEKSPGRHAFDGALALRKPQLKASQAAVAIAAAQKAQAALDLSHTRVAAPCDGVIVADYLARGQVVAAGDVALQLACTECYHLLATFPAAHDIDPQVATVFVDVDGRRYEGTIKAMLPGIEPATRQKRALIAFGGGPVNLDAYARVALPGPLYEDAVVLPHEALRPDDTVWVVDAKGRLALRTVTVLDRDREHVVIGQGLGDGDQVVVSHIANPLKGMPLRVARPAEQASVVPGKEGS